MVTIISFLLVLLILGGFIMEKGLALNFHNLAEIHREFPALFLIDLLPVFISIFLHPLHGTMNRAIEDYEERVKESNLLLDRNTRFAQKLSEGDNPEPYEEMMQTDLGKSLRMIQLNIKSNRRKEHEQSWIAEGKDIISKVLREQQEMDELSSMVLRAIIQYIKASQGALYLYEEEEKTLSNRAIYAYNRRKYLKQTFKIGEGLVGQCAYEMDYIYRTEIPEDYVTVTSGILGEQKPTCILLVPLITNEELHGVVELAFLSERIPKLTIQYLLELGEIIARTLKNLKMNLRTQGLLEESTKMTGELKHNEILLQENAGEMRQAKERLETVNIQLEGKIKEAHDATARIFLLLEHASEIIAIYNKAYNLIYISPSVINIFGYSVEEMMGGKDMERIGRDGAIKLRKTFDKLRENPALTATIETTFIRKNGERIYLSTHCRNMLEDSSIGGFVLNTRDITETVHMERETRLKSRMKSLSENSMDLILRVSNSGVIYYANPVVEDYSGIAPFTMINKTIDEIAFSSTFRELLDEVLGSMLTSPIKKNIQVCLAINAGEFKSERILNVDAIPEFQNNELETILIVGHDITEAKKIEKEMQVQNKKIQDSINYAERIQSSILPEIGRIRKAFPKSFVYYKPRDIISGDFPWLFETPDSWYIAAVDCTGHGVPGALLSMVGLFLMNNITGLKQGISAGDLCEELHQEVRRTLKQDRDKPETRDGMDIALCRFIKKQRKMEYAGAHRPLLILSEGEITMYKGDRKSIGGIRHPRKPEQAFTTTEISFNPGDKFFFFTDGLTDQMGGPEGLKYGSPRVRQGLLENAGYTMHQYNDYFRTDFIRWMGNERQLDDLLLIGIEVD